MPKLIKIEVLDNYILKLFYNNSEMRLFDMKPYLNQKPWNQIATPKKFNQVKIINGDVCWENGMIDMSPDTIEVKSILIDQ